MWQRGEEIQSSAAASYGSLLLVIWEKLASLLGRVKIRRKAHALRLEETLALGDRRMVAIVEWRGEKLLLGVTPQQITLLDPRTNSCEHRCDEVQGL